MKGGCFRERESDLYSLSCFIISPLSYFSTATLFSDGIFDADHEFDIIFYYDVILGVPRAMMTSFFPILAYLINYLR